MPYNGPVWQSTAGADKRGEIYLQAGENFGRAVGQGIAALGEKTKELASKRDAVQAAEGAWDVLSTQHPDLLAPFDEKFRTGSAGAKQGILSQAIAAIARKDEQGKEAENARRFGLNYGLQNATVANTAAYQQVQLDNQAADNRRQDKKLDYEIAPDNQKPVTVDMPGATAYGVTGEKSGTRIFNFIPKPKAPVQPGMVIDPKTGTGYFRDGAGKPVNPEYLLQSPAAPPAPSGPSTDLLPVPGDPNPPPTQLAPAPVAAPVPAPAQELPTGKPFTSRPELLVPRRTPAAPTGWKLKPSSGGVFAEKGDQVARWDEQSKQWIATDMPASAVPAPKAATPAPATTPAPKRWR